MSTLAYIFFFRNHGTCSFSANLAVVIFMCHWQAKKNMEHQLTVDSALRYRLNILIDE